MGRLYSATFEQVAVTAAQDLFELIAPADAALRIWELHISQSSDAGDTESEQLNLLLHRGTATGSGGSSVTPRPFSLGDAAFGGTCEANNTSQSVEGTILGSYSFNIMAGFDMVAIPNAVIEISPSGLFIVELQTVPADSLTMDGTLIFEEIGG